MDPLSKELEASTESLTRTARLRGQVHKCHHLPSPPFGAVTLTNVYHQPNRPSMEEARGGQFRHFVPSQRFSLHCGGQLSRALSVMGSLQARWWLWWGPWSPALRRFCYLHQLQATRVDPSSGGPLVVGRAFCAQCDWSRLEDVPSDHLLHTDVRLGHPIAAGERHYPQLCLHYVSDIS